MRIRLAGFPRSISLRAAAGIPRCRPAATRGVSARRSGVVSKIVVLVLVLDLGRTAIGLPQFSSRTAGSGGSIVAPTILGLCGKLPLRDAVRFGSRSEGLEPRKRVRLIPETGCEPTIRTRRSLASNLMLGGSATTPQDYPQ